jgi:hypothetical protein
MGMDHGTRAMSTPNPMIARSTHTPQSESRTPPCRLNVLTDEQASDERAAHRTVGVQESAVLDRVLVK